MVGDLIKALDLLLNTLRTERSADKKRQALAKELFFLYLDLCAMVERGRRILALAAIGKTSSTSNEAGRINVTEIVTLLTMQTEALADLSERLRAGVIGDILQLHTPKLSRELRCLLDYKNYRVWMTLDFLVNDGDPLPTELLTGSSTKQNSVEEDWILRLEARMDEGDSHPFRDGRLYPQYLLDKVRAVKDIERQASSRGSMKVDLVVTPEEIATGQKLLDDIIANTEQLRVFLLEKFELADVL
jgi:hypothetical protein